MVKLSTLVYATALGSVAFSAGFLTGTQVTVVYERQSGTISRNVLGGPEPETYVTINGIKYFSKIDGKDIGD